MICKVAATTAKTPAIIRYSIVGVLGAALSLALAPWVWPHNMLNNVIALVIAIAFMQWTHSKQWLKSALTDFENAH